ARKLYSIILILILYILPMVHTAVDWWAVRDEFIVHGDTATSILSQFLHEPLWMQSTGLIVYVLSTVVADCVMIWRCWVIWNKYWLPTMIPIVLLLTAFAVVASIFQLKPEDQLSGNRTAFIHSSIIYFSFSLATNATSAALIIYRIISVSRVAGTLTDFKGVVEAIVESSVLYTLITIVYLPMTAVDSFDNFYPQAILVHATGMIPTLIIARVALGYARPNSSWSQHASSIRFQSNNGNISAAEEQMEDVFDSNGKDLIKNTV
ncbi:hypothetical protein BDQ17DRAFT_1257637, partial [Cyathus striatus]